MAKPPQAHITMPDYPVVGIGASAGGISALQDLFESIPASPGLAFVIVQHLPPDRSSQLSQLLANWTPMSVREAADGVAVQRDCVFVAPPGQSLVIEDETFATRPRDRAGPRAGLDTIDGFFESLALDLGSRAVAVILSGTGADGAAGAVSVREAGGIVLVQDPETATHDGMPLAAIASGAADHVLRIGPLARELIASASPEYVRAVSAESWTGGVTTALDDIIELARTRAGFDLTGYKRTPLIWRIQHRMEARQVFAFADYVTMLRDDPSELVSLIRGIPIHVTEFFRDPTAWRALEREVIPDLFAKPNGGTIRAWTPACATGEEAYSLAMLLAEHESASKARIDFQVFATDASAEIVARASRGVFKHAAVSTLSPERQRRFFYVAEGGFRVKRDLRENMVFSPQDLLADPPISGLDLITCRNLLIYLEKESAQKVVRRLHASLRMGGYLFLGRGESLYPRQRDGFEELASNERIYRKIPSSTSGDVEGEDWGESLRITNEELQASREELQALSEELRVSNDQLNDSTVALEGVTAQLRDRTFVHDTQSDVLSSGAVMTLFLDEGLRVRWFTPAVTELFPLQSADMGRPITDLVQNFTDAGFIDDVESVMRTGLPHDGEVRGEDGRWYLKRIRPFHSSDAKTVDAGVAIIFTDIDDRKRTEESLQESERNMRGDRSWLRAQRDAYQSAMSGEPLSESLGVLVRTVVEQAEEGCRCAIYAANAKGDRLSHVVGMPESYARRLDGLEVSPESLACGLSTSSGKPVITPDVLEEPRWNEWTWLANEYEYRGCWSFPMKDSSGKLLGSVALYFREPRTPTARELETAAAVARTAGIILSRHRDIEERVRVAGAGRSRN